MPNRDLLKYVKVNKNMKKMIIVLTSIAAVILMVSSATAVPNANSELLVNEIN